MSRVIASGWMGAFRAALLAACLAGLPGAGSAMPLAPDIAASAQADGPSRHLHRIDTFPVCVEQRRCWTDDNGRRRCGEVQRCQECRYEKRCDSQGCAWRPVCEWGPYKPALETN